MRLLVACCEVTYTGRLTAHLPVATRLLVFKADGSVLVHDDSGGYKPLNWIRSVFRPEFPSSTCVHGFPMRDPHTGRLIAAAYKPLNWMTA
jgi:RecB family endonuclease NucS